MLFFQLINRRYERASTVLTSNKGFEEWGQILGDEVMAAALIDRLLHHCHIVNIRGSSYRMRKHTDLSKILPSDCGRSIHLPLCVYFTGFTPRPVQLSMAVDTQQQTSARPSSPKTLSSWHMSVTSSETICGRLRIPTPDEGASTETWYAYLEELLRRSNKHGMKAARTIRPQGFAEERSGDL